MIISTDSNFTFGQLLIDNTGDFPKPEIEVPVYSKMFTITDDTIKPPCEFLHDPSIAEGGPAILAAVYDDDTSSAVVVPMGNYAAVCDKTGIMFRLDFKLNDVELKDIPYYHIIAVFKYDDDYASIVIKMTHEVELFPNSYPEYSIIEDIDDALPTSSEAPGVTPTGTIQITENDTYDVTNYASAEVNVSGGSSDFSVAKVTFISNTGRYTAITPRVDSEDNCIITGAGLEVSDSSPVIIDIPLYKGKFSITPSFFVTDIDQQSMPTVSGGVSMDLDTGYIIITGDGTFTVSGTPIT